MYSVSLPAVPAVSPAFDDSSAYVAMANGQIAAMSLVDGSARWTIEAAAKGALAWGEGLLFVPGEGDIAARSTIDGAVKWRTPIGGTITAPLVWDGGWVIAGTDQHELIALRGHDGAIVWRVQVDETAMRARPALAGERMYVPLEDGRVLALDLRTGARVWEQRLGGPASDVLALEDRIFVGSKDNYFYCLDPSSGARKWRWRTGADVIGAPVVDGSRVFFVSLDNVLRSLSRGNGVLQWQQPLPLRPPSGPLLVDGMLVVSGVSVSLRGFRAKEGRPVGEYTAPAELAAPPHYVQKVSGAPAAPLLVLLLIDDTGSARLEAVTSELPVI